MKVKLQDIVRECRRRGIRFSDDTKSFTDFAQTIDGKKMQAVLKQIQEKGVIVGDAARKLHETAYANDRLIEQYFKMLDSAIEKGLDKKEAERVAGMLRNAKYRGRKMVAETADFYPFYDKILNGIK